MAESFSFDVVSDFERQELVNALDQVKREISQRYDLKGTDTLVNLDKENNAISFIRNNLNPESTYYRHIGIYAYRKNTLNLFTSLTQSDNEKNHRLEQLRALDNNIAIKLLISDFSHRSIDVKEDLKNYEN